MDTSFPTTLLTQMNISKKHPLLFNTATLAWLILIVATYGSTWWISEQDFKFSTVGVLVMLIGAIKVRIVLLQFMELKHAPTSLRVIFEAWLLICLFGILAFYLDIFSSNG